MLCARLRNSWLCAARDAWLCGPNELLHTFTEVDLPEDAAPNVESELEAFARASLANVERTHAILAVAALRAEVVRADRGQGLRYVELGVATKKFESSPWHWNTIEQRCDQLPIWVLWSVQAQNSSVRGSEQYSISVCRADKALSEGCFQTPKSLKDLTQQEISRLSLPLPKLVPRTDERPTASEVDPRIEPDAHLMRGPLTDAVFRRMMQDSRNACFSTTHHDSANVSEGSGGD